MKNKSMLSPRCAQVFRLPSIAGINVMQRVQCVYSITFHLACCERLQFFYFSAMSAFARDTSCRETDAHLMCCARLLFYSSTRIAFARDTLCRETDALLSMRRSMRISQWNYVAHCLRPNEIVILKLQVSPAVSVRLNATVIPKPQVSQLLILSQNHSECNSETTSILAVDLEPKPFEM